MKIARVIRTSGFLTVLAACSHPQDTGSKVPTEGPPVTVTHAGFGSLTDVITLNATSRFLLKTPVKSDVNGYLQKVNIRLG
jgi:hypothetical protein